MKKIPQRMCIVRREKKDKRDLLRIVKDKEGNISVDLTGKKNGKGAYLTKSKEIILQAKNKKILNKVFEMEVPDSVYEEILKLI